jgi:hypothetical protein
MGESQQGVIRMNISVPRELKARMDAEEGVNWSAVASGAFEGKLLEVASKKGVEDMDDVVARMKAAEQLESKEDYKAGFDAGQAWAKETATPKELRRVEKYIDRVAAEPTVNWWELEGTWGPSFFVWVAWPDRKGDEDAAESFWEQALGDDAERIKDPDFLRGFGDGAMDIWAKVKRKL